ncbi:hypothetical protein FRC10_009662 [Ceratobasidium sp. 414]|nr:hypothetical protein FRC10_009662 [Ceratobasidium sp. 414]
MSPTSLTSTSTSSARASTSTSRPTTSISPSSSRSVPSSSKLSSAQNPGAGATTPSSTRSATDPHSTTSRSYVELSRQLTTTATTVSRETESMSSSSLSQTLFSSASTSTSSPRSNSATRSGSISVVWSSTSASTMSSSSSATSSAPSASTLSPIAAPSTTRYVSNGSSSLPSTTFVSSSAETRSTEPTSALEPTMTSNPDPDVTPIYPPVIHNVVIDSGTCAGLGKPKVVTPADGRAAELTSLGNGRYSVALGLNEWGGQGVNVFLEDDGALCGPYGVCATVFVTFDPTTLTLVVERSGDRGLTMYPFSFWTDGGELFDGTPADSQAHKYNCWGWPVSDCRFSSMYPTDPGFALTSTTPNATAYITFCPPDGPSASSIGLNPDPPSPPPQQAVTLVILSTGTTAPVSTFVQVVTPSQLQHGLTPVTGTLMTVTKFGSTMSAPTPTTSPDPDSQSFLHPECSTAAGKPCIQFNTLLSIQETTIIPIGTSFFAAATMTSGVEPISTVTNVTPTPTPTPTRPRGGNGVLPTVTSWAVVHTDSVHSKPTSVWEVSTLPGSNPSMAAVLATLTDSLGMPIATSTLGAQVPTFSTITDSRGSAITTIPYNLTTTPPPETLYTLTSWTTWLTVNGSTVPVIAGQVGVLTTIPVTYVLEPSTTIPVGVLSSISVESTRTSLPSATAHAEADQVASGRGSKIAGAIVGSLVGAMLLGVLLWICLKRARRHHASDYAAHRSPIWGSGPGSAAGSGGGSELDLDSGPRPRESFVEPWVDQNRPQGSPTNRKMQREMEEYGQGIVTAGNGSRDTTGVSSSVGDGYGALRPGKSANRVPPELRPEPFDHWPARNNTLSSIRSQGSSSGHNHAPAASRSPSFPPRIPPARSPAPTSPVPMQPPAPVPIRRRYSEEPVGQEPRHNAIPPLYNEAWNMRPAPSSE